MYYSRVFLVLIFTTLNTKSPNRVRADRADNDEDYLHFFLDDAHGYIEENDGIKYLDFACTDKNKEALKIIK